MAPDVRLRSDTTVGEEWADYVANILRPAGAGEIQIEECKRAFYAGAFVMFGIVSNIGAEAPDEDTGAARLEQARRECVDYFKNFGKRHGVP